MWFYIILNKNEKFIEKPNQNLIKNVSMKSNFHMSGLSRETQVPICPDARVLWDRVLDRAGPPLKLAGLSCQVPCPSLILNQKVNFLVENNSQKNQMFIFYKCKIK